MSDTNSTPLRVGLIGYGLGGAVFHAPLIATTPGLVLDTVVTGAPERQQQARREHPGVRVVPRVEELLARADRLDLVVVASPNRTHVPLATAVLKAGLPVVVDKPVAGTPQEAETLAELADSRGLLFSVYHNRRWDTDFLTLRSLLDRGALGEVWRFESRFERWRPTLSGNWRESGDPAEHGGLLYDLGSHLVDQALQLFGPVTRVHAETAIRRPGAGSDDDTFLALRHAGGVHSHLWMSATASRPGPRLRVLGSRGGYVKEGLDPQEAALRAGRRPEPGVPWGTEPETAWGTLGVDGEEPTAVPSVPGDYRAYYVAVARALRDGGEPPVTAAEAIEGLRVLQAARRAAATGETVRLDEPR